MTDSNKYIMIRCLYIFFFYVISTLSSYGQSDYYGENLNSNSYTAAQVIGNTTVQPPDVSAFAKVNFVPVSNYTGRVDVSVPLYEVTSGALSVPISLSYNSSGVKVNDMASSVGLNWSLNVGGVISRMIKGMDDFYVPTNPNRPEGTNTPAGWLGYLHPYAPSLQSSRSSKYNDAEPDIFNVSAPGLSTKYIHRYSQNVPIELEQNGNIIKEVIEPVTKRYFSNRTNKYQNITVFGLKKVDITSTSGVIYSFASPDISTHHGGTSGAPFNGFSKIESYRLDKMFDPSTNQEINFEYEEYSNYFYDNIWSKSYAYGGGTGLNYGNELQYNIYPVTQRLKKINFDHGSVEFIYGLVRQDNEGDRALTELIVKDHNGKMVKRIKMDYSYFQSPINTNSPQSKRLKLDRVYHIDAQGLELPGHKFTYNTSIAMPPRGTYAQDFLGYNNGSYSSGNNNPIPKYYVKTGGSFNLVPFYDSSYISIPGNFSLEANESFAKAYSLTKVTFPTGGENIYEYELNEFNFLGLKKGGGLRVKSQKLIDGRGNIQILDYTYTNGSIVKMPTYAVYRLKSAASPRNISSYSSLLNGLGINTFISPQSQIEFTQGSFVGYKNVKVENRINNGYTEYEYSSPLSYPDTKSTKIYDTENYGGSRAWADVSSSITISNDYLRGKLLNETVYTKQGKKRMNKKYVYSKKVFSSIKLEYLSKAANHPQDDCYAENGTYELGYRNCYGFKEEIELPIARNLLTSIFTNDYQPEFDDSTTRNFEKNLEYTFQTGQSYTYDLQYPLLIRESKYTRVCEEENQQGGQDCANVYGLYKNTSISKVNTYPLKGGLTTQDNTVSNLPYANQLLSLNKLNVPLRTKYYGVENYDEDYIYKTFPNGIISLEKIKYKNLDVNLGDSDVITKIDSKGRVLEYKLKNGQYVSRFYGYDDMYMVAEAVNSTYADLISKLQSLDAVHDREVIYFDQGTMSNSPKIITFLNELRKKMPKVNITSYTYKPLVGVSSITDVRGYTNYYEYDSFNRLNYILDIDKNVVSKNNYNYKN
ncbi:MAG: hypothetical protein ACSHW4_13015 [Cellulophaga sp.]